MSGLVVIGSGPAGVAAATAYRDNGGQGPIVLLTSDNDPPYQRPPLTKEVLAGRTDNDAVPIDEEDPGLHGVELRLHTTVEAIDIEAKTVTTGMGELIPYDNLVICAGAQPIEVEGLPDSDAHVLRSLEQARSVVAAAKDARTAIVVGSGFIGCEAAASLASRGVQVTMLTRSEQPQVDRVGQFAADQISKWLADAGVTVRTGVAVAQIVAPRTVVLESGEGLSADLVLVALGVRPVGDLGAGLITDDHGRIEVDDHMATKVAGIWAAGDNAAAEHAIAGRRVVTEHWDDATTQGAIAGTNAAGGDRSWTEIPSFWSEIGEHPLQYAGWGDGFDSEHPSSDDQGWTVWYGKDGKLVAVLTSNHYDDDDRGKELITAGKPVPN